jgi:hypothetical protein
MMGGQTFNLPFGGGAYTVPGTTGQQTPAGAQGLNVDPNDPDFGTYARDFGMQDFQQDPGYEFRMSEGMKALERSAAARGGLLSGSMLKGIQRFGQDMGSQEYQNAFNRYQVNRSNQLNPLQSLMGSGQSATNTLTGAAGDLEGHLEVQGLALVDEVQHAVGVDHFMAVAHGGQIGGGVQVATTGLLHDQRQRIAFGVLDHQELPFPVRGLIARLLDDSVQRRQVGPGFEQGEIAPSFSRLLRLGLIQLLQFLAHLCVGWMGGLTLLARAIPGDR